MNTPFSRGTRWSTFGAIVGIVLAALLGIMFALIITLANPLAARPDSIGGWAALLTWNALIWALPGAFFGWVLGYFASLIWKPEE